MRAHTHIHTHTHYHTTYAAFLLTWRERVRRERERKGIREQPFLLVPVDYLAMMAPARGEVTGAAED